MQVCSQGFVYIKARDIKVTVCWRAVRSAGQRGTCLEKRKDATPDWRKQEFSSKFQWSYAGNKTSGKERWLKQARPWNSLLPRHHYMEVMGVWLSRVKILLISGLCIVHSLCCGCKTPCSVKVVLWGEETKRQQLKARAFCRQRLG